MKDEETSEIFTEQNEWDGIIRQIGKRIEEFSKKYPNAKLDNISFSIDYTPEKIKETWRDEGLSHSREIEQMPKADDILLRKSIDKQLKRRELIKEKGIIYVE